MAQMTVLARLSALSGDTSLAKRPAEPGGAGAGRPRWLDLAELSRPLTNEEKSEAKGAQKALDYSFLDASKIQLFGTPEEKQEYRNRLSLSSMLKNKSSASSALGAGLIESFPFSGKVIKNAQEFGQDREILDRIYDDERLKDILDQNDALADARGAGPLAYGAGSVAGSLAQLGAA